MSESAPETDPSGPSWPAPPMPPSHDELVFEDDVPVESMKHADQMQLFAEAIRKLWSGRTNFFVGKNCALYYSSIQARNRDFRAPDVQVVKLCEPRPREGWVVWEEEGKRPDLVLEILSPTTEHEDRGRKKDIYARLLGVPEYYLFDVNSGRFDAYRLISTKGEYAPVEPDAEGRVASEVLEVRVGPWTGLYGSQPDETIWLRLFDDHGPIPTWEEHALAQAKRAEAEAKRAEAAEAELARLRAMLAKSGRGAE